MANTNKTSAAGRTNNVSLLHQGIAQNMREAGANGGKPLRYAIPLPVQRKVKTLASQGVELETLVNVMALSVDVVHEILAEYLTFTEQAKLGYITAAQAEELESEQRRVESELEELGQQAGEDGEEGTGLCVLQEADTNAVHTLVCRTHGIVPLRYSDISQIKGAERTSQYTQQADLTLTLRTQLLRKANELLAGPNSANMKAGEVAALLRVVGVSQAPTNVPGHRMVSHTTKAGYGQTDNPTLAAAGANANANFSITVALGADGRLQASPTDVGANVHHSSEAAAAHVAASYTAGGEGARVVGNLLLNTNNDVVALMRKDEDGNPTPVGNMGLDQLRSISDAHSMGEHGRLVDATGRGLAHLKPDVLYGAVNAAATQAELEMDAQLDEALAAMDAPRKELKADRHKLLLEGQASFAEAQSDEELLSSMMQEIVGSAFDR